MASRQLEISRKCTPVVDARYEKQSEDTPVTAIVGALARAEGVDTTELAPLQDLVDTDAVNRLFDGPAKTETVLSFEVDHWNVFISSDGRIRVCDTTQSTEPAPVFESHADEE